jgi:hypothetical protein
MLDPVERLSRDLVQASKTLGNDEARYLVDAYYTMQEARKRTNNQVKALDGEEPHSLISWFADQNDTLEKQIKRALQSYAESFLVGQWSLSIYGIGPVITAGMLAHIDIHKAKTAGAIWRLAGLDPTVKWKKKQKRPWNAKLKTLCWKTGQCFMKFHNHPDCVYGKVYELRKEYEINRNERGENTELATQLLKKFRPTTEAYKYLQKGVLPPAQIDARARRYAVKLFLSHLQMVWFFATFNKLPSLPYPLTHLKHAHMITPPNMELIPGLIRAVERAGI